MKVRALLGSLQVPIAAIGLLGVAAAVGGIVTLDPPPAGSEGFLSGLAILFLYFLGWMGFLVLALGLAIPPGDGYGITFNRYQRGLFVVAAVGALASAVGPFVAFGLVYSNPSLLFNSWLVITSVAVLSLVGGLVWRGVEALRAWRVDGGGSTSSDSSSPHD